MQRPVSSTTFDETGSRQLCRGLFQVRASTILGVESYAYACIMYEPGSFCINYNTSRTVLNKFSSYFRPVSGLDDFQPLNFQMKTVFELVHCH